MSRSNLRSAISVRPKRRRSRLSRPAFILRCVQDDSFFAGAKSSLGPATLELVTLMRERGTCSSWGWHADSIETCDAAKALIVLSSHEQIGEPRQIALLEEAA